MKRLVVTAGVALALVGCSKPATTTTSVDTSATTPVVTTESSSPGSATPSTTAPATESAASSAVTISGSKFSPATLTVKVGTTVTWTNQDALPHIVASDPHPTHTKVPGLVSASLSKGGSFSFTFDKAGTFTYHCHLHPEMTGTIVVQ